MLVSDIHVLSGQGCCELRARVKSEAEWVNGNEPFWLWYRFPESFRKCLSPENGDPFLAALLGPAMVTGEPLEIRAPVSAQLLRSAAQIETIYQCWDPVLSRVVIRAPVRPRRFPSLRRLSRVGLFFSLGMDSFYSLLKNVRDHPADADTITDLLVIYGFNIVIGNRIPDIFPTALAPSARVAQELGKNLVPVIMNLREFAEQLVDWGELYHGAALASVALALQPAFRRMHIAATHAYDDPLRRCGTHPLLDPLWSTEGLSFIHDGLEASRPDKARLIGQFPIAMETLRVCVKNPDDQQNCGRCRKCLTTMICLHVAGALKKCRTLPHTIDLDLCRHMLAGEATLDLSRSLVNVLRGSDADPGLRAALEEYISKSQSFLREQSRSLMMTDIAAPVQNQPLQEAGAAVRPS